MNPFKLKKFKGKSFEDISETITKNWYNYGHCIVCGKKARKINYEFFKNGGHQYHCSTSCSHIHRIIRYGQCEKCEIEPNFAYECVIICPVHGRSTYGTSD